MPAKRKPAVDPYELGFAQRVYAAFHAYNASQPRAEKISQEVLGERVAKRLGLSKAPTQTAVSRWMSDINPSVPEAKVIAAIAAVLETDPAWLAFGGKARGHLPG